ncbi:MAG: Gfo/Idh/MocA family protein [Planctomycetota bacterium]|jgi:predicted dehydrogenase
MARKLKHVRFGIIGMGMMGSCHADILAKDRDRRFSLTAVADIDADKAKAAGETYDVAWFASGEEMIESGLCDAVIVATPHYWHAPLTIRAARAGLHVMCEKPLASTVGHARAMIAECKKRRVQLGVMLHHRARGDMHAVKKLVDSGAIGEVFRAQLVCSNWFRTQAYYDSGAWRGTWDGEGGGALINQAPHHLDLYQWIAGMPKKVLGLLSTRCHKIEVEDCANFLLDYGKGKVGYIYATTAEEPGYEQFMLCGDKGTIVVEEGKVKLGKLKVPVSRHIFASANSCAGGAEQGITWKDIKPLKRPGGHIEITRGFVQQILTGVKPFDFADGQQALNELELSNAMYLAGFKEKAVDLPVDADQMERLISKLERERSTGKGQGIRRKANADFRRLLAGGESKAKAGLKGCRKGCCTK